MAGVWKFLNPNTGEYEVLSSAPGGSSSGMAVVQHGDDASVARPSGALAVYWMGTVEPTNMANGDQWYDSTGDA